MTFALGNCIFAVESIHQSGESAMTETYHIRTRPPKRGGSQWYRDKRVFDVVPLCGADAGDKDIAWNWNAVTWTDAGGTTYVPCEACVLLRGAK